MNKWILRVAKFIAVAVAVSCLELGINHCIHTADRPAGFMVGIADGALMPMAMPALLAGKDMPIYAANNCGRLYKLGYTVGVNGCGAIFFGVLFWRVTRWFQSRQKSSNPTAKPTS
jgi:cyanate permease